MTLHLVANDHDSQLYATLLFFFPIWFFSLVNFFFSVILFHSIVGPPCQLMKVCVSVARQQAKTNLSLARTFCFVIVPVRSTFCLTNGLLTFFYLFAIFITIILFYYIILIWWLLLLYRYDYCVYQFIFFLVWFSFVDVCSDSNSLKLNLKRTSFWPLLSIH